MGKGQGMERDSRRKIYCGRNASGVARYDMKVDEKVGGKSVADRMN